jgi:hypothetical protein
MAAALGFRFGKSPGAVKEDRPFNMEDSDDIKLYEKAIAPITKKNEALFDLSSGRLLTFLSMFATRAKEWGWNSPPDGILHIPVDAADPNSPTDSLLELYGQIDMERIRRYERTYIHTEVRIAQDTEMMAKCLMASLTEDAVAKIMLVEDEYHIAGEPSGNLLLRIIIRESSLDSNATATVIRTKLSTLEHYMPQVKSNIKEFNTYVKLQLKMLTARGETTNDLLVHLFAAYQKASDKNFREEAKRELKLYERGQAITPHQLMASMEQYWEVLVQKGEWDAPSDEEQQLMVMRAELEELRESKKAPAQDYKPKTAYKGKSKDSKSGRKYAPDPDWLANNEKPSPIDKIAYNRGSAWYWCSTETGGKCAGCWRKHKPKDCKGTARTMTPYASSALPGGTNKELKLFSAFQALMAENDDMDE